jgi:hypothetical protein
MVTCPSPAITTFPLRRTHKMVVERIFLCIFKPLFQHSGTRGMLYPA